MADVTFGVKVSEELKEKVNQLIEASGMKSKDWFENVVRLVEMQQLKEAAPDFSKDLSELELHTNRINQLITNMVQRTAFEKEELTRKMAEERSKRDEVILGYQQEIVEYKEQLAQMKKEVEASAKVKEELEQQRNQLQEVIENNKALIGEYKEKIDTLTGLVNEYKEAMHENKYLKEENRQLYEQQKENSALIEQLRTKLDDQKAASKEREEQLLTQIEQERKQFEEKIKEELTHTEEKWRIQLERLEEKKEIEKERALIALRTELQDKQQALIESHVQKIEVLYEENRQLREQYKNK